MYNGYVDISVFTGKIFKSVTNHWDEIDFETYDGTIYRLYHEQDCCESVAIEDIEGNLNDLVDTVILVAEEISDDSYEVSHEAEYSQNSHIWKFYRLGSAKGYVTIRWYWILF